MGGACSLGPKHTKKQITKHSSVYTPSNSSPQKENVNQNKNNNNINAIQNEEGKQQEFQQNVGVELQQPNRKVMKMECLDVDYKIGKYFMEQADDAKCEDQIKGESKWRQFIDEGWITLEKLKGKKRIGIFSDNCPEESLNQVEKSLTVNVIYSHKVNKLDFFLGKGYVPQQDRWSAWKIKVGVSQYFQKGIYEMLKKKECPCLKNILKDVGRTFVGQRYFQIEEKQQSPELTKKSLREFQREIEEQNCSKNNKQQLPDGDQNQAANASDKCEDELAGDNSQTGKNYQSNAGSRVNYRKIDLSENQHSLKEQRRQEGQNEFEQGRQIQIFRNVQNLVSSAAASNHHSNEDKKEIPNFAKTSNQSENIQSVGQESLHRVLRALSNYFPQLKYTQGMNFIIGFFLLINGGNEEEAFWMFVTLAQNENYLIMGLYENAFPLIDILKFMIEVRLESIMPELHHHIRENLEILYEEWFFQWAITLFLDKFALKEAIRFWDFLISEGSIFSLISLSLSILQELKGEILQARDHGEFHELFNRLREDSSGGQQYKELSVEAILDGARTLRLNKSLILNLTKEYIISQREVIQNNKQRVNIYSCYFSSKNQGQAIETLKRGMQSRVLQSFEEFKEEQINQLPTLDGKNQDNKEVKDAQSEERRVILKPQIDNLNLDPYFNLRKHKKSIFSVDGEEENNKNNNDINHNNNNEWNIQRSYNKALLPPIKQGRKGSNHMHIPDESNEPAKNKLKAIKQTDKSSPHREDNNPNEDSSFKGLDKNQSRLPPLNIIYNPINPKKIQESNLQQENYGNVLVTNIDNESNQTPMVDHKARNWRQQDFFNDSKDTHHASKQLFNQPHKVKKKIQRANSSSFQSNQERSTSVYKKTKLLLNLSNFPKGHEQTNGNNAQDIFKKSSQISNELIQTNQQSSKISNLGIQSLRKPTHDTIISQKQPSPKEVMSEKDVTQQILRHPNSSSSSSSSSTSSLVVLKKQNIPQELNIHKQTPKLKQEKAAPDQIQKTKEIEDDDFNFVQGGMKITESQRYSLSSSRRRQSVNSQGKEQSHTKKTSSLLIIQGTPQQQQQLDSQHIPSYAASGEIKSKLFSSVQSQRTPLQHYFPNEEMANKPFGQLSPEIDKAQTYLNRVLSSQLLSEDSQQQQHSGSSSRNKNKFIKLKQSYNPHFHRSQIYQSNRSIHMQDTGNNTQKDLERYVVVVKDIQKNDEQLDNQNKLQFNTQQQPASLRTEVTIVQNNQYNENNNQASSDVRTLKQNDIEETNENHLGNYVIEQNVSLVKQTDQQVQPAGLQQTQTELQSQNDNHSINLERHDVEDYQENQFNTISSSVKPAAAVMSLEAEKLAEEIAQAHEISQIKMKDSSDESESQSQNENEIHKINHGNQNDPSSVGNTQREIEASERQPGRQSLVPRQREDTNLSGYITNLHPHNISGFSEQVNSISAVQLGQIQQTKKDLSMLQIHSPAHSTHRRSSQDQDKEREKQQQQQQDEQDIPERIEDKQSKGEDYSVTQNKIHNRCDNGGDDSMNKNTHNPLEQSPMIIFDESVNSISASTARCPPLPQFTPQTDRRQQQVTKTIPQVGNGSNKNDRNKNTKSNSLRLIGTSVVQNSFSQQKTIPALGQQQQQQQLKNNSSTPIRNSENLERNQFSDILDQQGQSQPGNDKVNNFVHSGQNVLGLFAQSAAHLQQIEEEMCTTEQLTSQYPGGLSPQRRRSTLNNRNNNNKSIDLKGKIDRLNESSHRIEVQNNNTLNQQNQPLEFQDQSLNRLNSSNLSSRTNQSWHSRYSGISKDNGQDKNPQTEHQANNNNNKPLSYHRTFGKHRIIGSTTAHTNILNSSLNNNSISNTQKTANMILNNEQKQMIISEYPPNNNQTLPMISPSSRQQHKSSASSDLIGIKEAIQAESGIDKQSHTGTSKLIPINLPLQQVVL